MSKTLQERCDWRGADVRVDRPGGVLRGVKILGIESRNGRSYLPEALQQSAALYEGAKVNVNHPAGAPAGSRDYRDRIGVIRNVRLRRAEGLFGDFHFNPKHALAEQLLWDAEHAPQNVGFSHNVEARTSRRGDKLVVEAISRVHSVDLVADPATTRGLFESTDDAGTSDGGHNGPAAWNDLTLEDLREHRPDLLDAIAAERSGELEQLREQLEGLRAAQATQQKRETIRRLLREYKLPDPDAANGDGWAGVVVSEQFVHSLLEAADETAMRQMIAERAKLVGAASGRPQARDPHTFVDPGPQDAQAFARAIT